MEKNRIRSFLLLQCSMLLLFMAMLPQFDLIKAVSGVDLDFGVMLCKLVFSVVGGVALFQLFNACKGEGGEIPMPFFISAVIGLFLALLSVFNVLPEWLEYFAIPAFAVALYMAKGSLKIEWKKVSSQGAYLILLALTLHLYKGIDDAFLIGVGAIVGLFLYLKGLGILAVSLDESGVDGCGKLKIAVILAIISVVVDFIPLLGWLATILVIVAFVFEFMGYGLLAKSQALSEEGRCGAKKLRISMIVLLVGAVLSFIPFAGAKIEAVASFVALILIFLGWSQMLFGLEGEKKEIGLDGTSNSLEMGENN